MKKAPEAELSQLLESLFSPDGALTAFVTSYYKHHLNHIGAESVGVAQRAQNLVRHLEARGEIDPLLFERMLEGHEKRSADIEAVRDLWIRPPTDPGPRTGEIVVRIHPPEGLVRVTLARPSAPQTPLLEGRTNRQGIFRFDRAPAGRLLVSTQIEVARGAVQNISTEVDLGPEERLLVDLGGGARAGLGERALLGVRSLSRRHPRVAMGLLALALLLVGPTAALVDWLSPPPDGVMYVEPIDYWEGFRERPNPPYGVRVLTIIADYARRQDINRDTLFPAVFSNFIPKSAEGIPVEAYELEDREITVPRYKRYLDQLPPEERAASTPTGWDQQVQAQRQLGWTANSRTLPVSGLTHEQAEAICAASGGMLPSSEQWEIAARNLAVNDPEGVGTLYPWGDQWESTANTEEARHDAVVPTCTTKDRTRQGNPRVCDLAGNLQEWTRDLAKKAMDDPGDAKIPWYYVRGGWYGDNGKLGALSYMHYFRLPAHLSAEVQEGGTAIIDAAYGRVGARCVYAKDFKRTPLSPAGQPGDPTLAQFAGGAYHNLGRPQDPIFTQFAVFRSDATFLLAAPTLEKDVGGFYVQREKVTNQEYERYLSETDEGRGPWSTQIGTPPTYSHVVIRNDGPRDPVQGVSWLDAYSYCAWRGMRLPKAVEWERIVRGNSGYIFPWGDEEEDGARFFDATGPDVELIRNMWEAGPEWTSTDGWVPGVDTRLLTGLLARSVSLGPYAVYFASARSPQPIDQKIPEATIRCVLDHQPGWIQRVLKWRSPGLTAITLRWPQELPPLPVTSTSPTTTSGAQP